MAGIEITDEMTSEQLEAMTGGEQLKAEVCRPQHCSVLPKTPFVFDRMCVTTCRVAPGARPTDATVTLPTREAILARSEIPRSRPSG